MLERSDLEKLAELARIEIAPDEEDKLLHDLEQILKHFGELKDVATEGVAPRTGGAHRSNAVRADEPRSGRTETAQQAFPESSQGFLKVPPVFE